LRPPVDHGGGIMGVLELILFALLQLLPHSAEHQQLKERSVPPISEPKAPPSTVQSDVGSDVDPNG
jgi:hypothetical protein